MLEYFGKHFFHDFFLTLNIIICGTNQDDICPILQTCSVKAIARACFNPNAQQFKTPNAQTANPTSTLSVTKV